MIATQQQLTDDDIPVRAPTVFASSGSCPDSSPLEGNDGADPCDDISGSTLLEDREAWAAKVGLELNADAPLTWRRWAAYWHKNRSSGGGRKNNEDDYSPSDQVLRAHHGEPLTMKVLQQAALADYNHHQATMKKKH